MRARRRRSVMNTISAAALEVAIMGIFVIIAQPQLRDALFEILQVEPPVAQASSHGLTTGGSATRSTAVSTNVSPTESMATTIANSLGQLASHRPVDLPAPALLSPASSQFAESPSMVSLPAVQGWREPSVSNPVAANNPFDQYETLRVSVPASNPAHGYAQSYVSGPSSSPANNRSNYDQVRVSQYAPVQNYQTYAPTQLNANQWNIASAAQSRGYANAGPQFAGNQANQFNNHNTNINNTNNAQHWIPSQVTETSFRQPYPPPYGTQSMWK